MTDTPINFGLVLEYQLPISFNMKLEKLKFNMVAAIAIFHFLVSAVLQIYLKVTDLIHGCYRAKNLALRRM